MKRAGFWSWFWVGLGALYFLLPLYATLVFSLRMQKGRLSFMAYQKVLSDPQFVKSFLFSAEMAALTIVISLLLIVPTAYWVHLKLPKVRPLIEIVTMLPFVIPAVVLVFGLIQMYSHPPLLFTSSPLLLVMGYTVLALPYMYRAVDNGLKAMDVRALTEAAQSLGAGWVTILARVIFPNLRVALLSGMFLTFAIVIGELTMAALLAWPALGPYMALLGQNRAYEPAALAIMSFALTWGVIGLIQLISRGAPGGAEGQLGGTH
jgi:putative spermidine/putrescine transport system permease protein